MNLISTIIKMFYFIRISFISKWTLSLISNPHSCCYNQLPFLLYLISYSLISYYLSHVFYPLSSYHPVSPICYPLSFNVGQLLCQEPI